MKLKFNENKKQPNVLLITQGLSFFTEYLLSSNCNIVGVLESAPRGYIKKKFFYNVIFFFAIFFSRILKRNINLRSKLKSQNISYRFMVSNEDPGLIEWIHSIKPDIIIVYSMSHLLKKKIYSIPKFGSINFHPSWLPDYRGPNPNFWQTYNLELNPGVTIHHINEGEDTGDIIKQQRYKIPLGISFLNLKKKYEQLGASLMLKTLENIDDLEMTSFKQNLISPTKRAKNLSQNDYKNMIQWNDWPVERVWHILRGSENLVNILFKQKITNLGRFWKVEEYEKKINNYLIPGNIYNDKNIFFISCKDGCIYLSKKFSLKKLFRYFLKI